MGQLSGEGLLQSQRVGAVLSNTWSKTQRSVNEPAAPRSDRCISSTLCRIEPAGMPRVQAGPHVQYGARQATAAHRKWPDAGVASVNEANEDVSGAGRYGVACVAPVSRVQDASALCGADDGVDGLQQGPAAGERPRVGEQDVEGKQGAVAVDFQLALPIRGGGVVPVRGRRGR